MFYLISFIVIAVLVICLSKKKKQRKKDALQNKMQNEILDYQFSLNGKRGFVIPVTSKDGELNSAYEDINFAKSCFSLAIKNSDSDITYVQNNEDPTYEVIIHDALCKAAIISYARSFVSSKAGRSQLGIDVLNNKERDTHNELMHIRHTFIAHAGYADIENAYEFIATYILLDPDNIIDPEICALNRRAKGFSQVKIQEYLNLIDKLLLLYKIKLVKNKKNIYKQEVKGRKDQLYNAAVFTKQS